MRALTIMFLFLFSSIPAFAEDVVPHPATTVKLQPAAAVVSQPAPTTAAQPAAAASLEPAATPSHKGRVTWQQHFAAANVTHDGHLTLEQAQNGYVTIARSFAEIDASHKGYVTEEDIRAWHALKRAARHGGRQAQGTTLRPRSAALGCSPGDRPMVSAAATQTGSVGAVEEH